MSYYHVCYADLTAAVLGVIYVYTVSVQHLVFLCLRAVAPVARLRQVYGTSTEARIRQPFDYRSCTGLAENTPPSLHQIISTILAFSFVYYPTRQVAQRSWMTAGSEQKKCRAVVVALVRNRRGHAASTYVAARCDNLIRGVTFRMGVFPLRAARFWRKS